MHPKLIPARKGKKITNLYLRRLGTIFCALNFFEALLSGETYKNSKRSRIFFRSMFRLTKLLNTKKHL